MIIKRIFKGFCMSLGMFSIIPPPYKGWDTDCMNTAIACFPLTGLMVGIVWGAALILPTLIPIPIPIKAGAVALIPFLMTGFLHLDGFMDTSDAILSRRPTEDKLRIIKDPHTGAFAVISVCVLFTIMYSSAFAIAEKTAYVTLDSGAGGVTLVGTTLLLLLTPVISRSLTGTVLITAKLLPGSGYGRMFRTDVSTVHKLAVIFSGAAAGAVLIGTGVVTGTTLKYAAVLAATLTGFAFAVAGAIKDLGGVSGDVAGFALTITECCMLLACALVL